MTNPSPQVLHRLQDLPLVEQTHVIDGQRYTIKTGKNHDALLEVMTGRELIPFGLTLWESAVVLAGVVANRAGLGPNVRVLELGAGVALPTLVAARRGARVTILDIDDLAVALAEDNVRANGLSERVSCVTASWSDPPKFGQFDFVLGADIIYDTDEHDAILDFLELVLAPDGTALFTDPNRLTLVAFTHWLEERGWRVTEHRHTTPDLSGNGASVGVTLVEARRGVTLKA